LSNHEIIFVNDSFTGGHYALKNKKAKNAFKNPMQSCKSIKLFPSDIVVDIGAYVGEYALYASRFAKQVIAYEASPYIFEVLKMNSRDNIRLHNKAVVGDDRKETQLYLSKGMGATNSIVKKIRKKNSICVECANYTEIVKPATVVKIDVEGAEYGYDIVQPHLRAIILEFHPISGIPLGGWRGKAVQIMEEIQLKGFTPTMVPSFKNGWDTNSAWARPA